MSGAPARESGPREVVVTAARLLVRHRRPAYRAAGIATLANTVPDVLRHIPVWRSPSRPAALAVDVVGFLTGLAAQLWITGAVADLPDGGGLRTSGALRRGTALAWTAARTAPATALAGVAVGGSVSAVLTLPPSVAALGFGRVLGPLDDPAVGRFAVATVSDQIASWVTLPYLALVLAIAGRPAGAPAGGPAGRVRPAPGRGRAEP